MSMTRKDYVYIAAALKQAVDDAKDPVERLGARSAALRVAAAIGCNNATFDYPRFLAASGAL